jgi:hypothetical protein
MHEASKRVQPMRREKVSQSGSMTASEMGRKRWARVSPEERKEALAKARAHINLSPEERSQIARKAIAARWEKWREEHPEKANAAVRAHDTNPSTRKQKQTRSRKHTPLMGG